jgi:hypothetical protein
VPAPTAATILERAGERPHPRLVFTAEREAALKQRLTTDPLAQDLVDGLRQGAELILTETVCERIQTGRRLLFVSRMVLKRVLLLAMVYRLEGDQRFLDRARDEMLAAAAFSDWNPSHWLDVAEMSMALAFGYDWLFHHLSAADRATIRQALNTHGINNYQPLRRTNNWNDVCNGSMIVTALALTEDDPGGFEPLLAPALNAWPIALNHYGDGTHPEGPSWYWGYATMFSCLTFAALDSAADTDCDLLAAYPGFLRSAYYYLHMHGPTGLQFNYSDAGSGTAGAAPQQFWFAERNNDSDLHLLELARLRSDLAAGTACRNRIAPFALLWLPEQRDAKPPQALSYCGTGPAAVSTHRQSWTDPASAFLGCKAGTPQASHAHLDLGSFVYERFGQRWAIDLGAQEYDSLEQAGVSLWDKKPGAQRWDVFRLGAAAHSVLMINGANPQVEATARFLRHGSGFSIIDLSESYPELTAATRGLRLLADGSLLIQDQITVGTSDVTLRWAMTTPADLRLADDAHHAVLRLGQHSLQIHSAGPAVTWAVFATNPPPQPYDVANPGTAQIGFTTTLAAGSRHRLTVHLRAPSEAPAVITDLDSW